MLHQENKIMPRRAKCEVYNASSCAINHLPVHWIQHRSFFSKSVEKNTAEDTATKSNFPDNKKTTNENRNKCKIVPAWQDLLIKT